jgi:hypothetical protein
MYEKVIRDIIDKIVDKLYNIDYFVLMTIDIVNAHITHTINAIDINFALRVKDWEFVKKAYVKTVLANIIHDIRCTRFAEKSITDEDKNRMVKMFTDILSPHEYEKYANEIIEDVERLIANASETKSKK